VERGEAPALSGFLPTELLILLLMLLLLLMTLLLGDKCRREIVEAVVLGEGGGNILSALASASSSELRSEDEPARLILGLRTLKAMFVWRMQPRHCGLL
jgi:hypothetical protein